MEAAAARLNFQTCGSPCCPTAPHPDNFPVEITTTFDEGKHLSLHQPDEILSLSKDLHYDPTFVSDKLASDFACTSSFQVLSEEGMAVMDESVNCMEKHALSCARIPRVVRGGSFRSRFMDGLSHSPAILRLVSDLAGCELIPHIMKIHHLHLNFNPLPTTADAAAIAAEDVKEVEEGSSGRMIPRKKQRQEDSEIKTKPKQRIDKWHCDTTGFVIVLFCTDPDLYQGGSLQYFTGTQQEGIEYFQKCRLHGEEFDAHTDSRVRSISGGQRKGHGVFMQGSRVYHQVTPVLSGRDRTTAVFSFQPRNVLALEACDRLAKTYNLVDPLHVFLPDWVRYRAWKMGRRLEMFFEHIEAAEVKEETTVGTKAGSDSNISQSDEVPRRASKNGCIATTSKKSSASSSLLPIANRTMHSLMHLAQTLKYTDDRVYLTDELKSVCADLCAEMSPYLQEKKSGADINMNSTALAEKEEEEEDGEKHQQVFHTASKTYGIQNFLALCAEIDSCVDDVLNLKQVDAMEYF